MKLEHNTIITKETWGRCGLNILVLGFTSTCAINSYHHSKCEFEARSWRGGLDTTLCDKVFSDLRQVSVFLWVLRFPPPIKLTTTI